MATITPSLALIRRLTPAIAIEALALAGCVVGYVLTDNLAWIFGAVAVAAVFILWTLYTVFTHRDEWRWNDGTLGTEKKS